jgi:Domain of unknown function (DUF4136)
MKTWIKATIALSLLSLVACTGLSVSTDFDTNKDFSSMRTYAWLEPEKKLITNPLVENDLMDRRIKRAVARQLVMQGYTPATGDQGADFLVSYYVTAEDKLSINSFRSRYGYYPCWHGCFGRGHGGGFGDDLTVRQYKQGTFMLDMINPATKELMWRGVAGKRLSKGSPEERDEYVDGIITSILEEFPPSS